MKIGTIVKHKLTGQKMIVVEEARRYEWSGSLAPLVKCEWVQEDGGWTWRAFPEEVLEIVQEG